MRVVFDTQVWVRGLLAKKPNSIGSTLLRAARNGLFECVGSQELLEELDETLSAPNIAPKLTREQAIEARALVAALVQPLVEISGETMGCEDPEDDHILELAVKGAARFIVTRDGLILSLKLDARKRLDDGKVTVFRDDVFCGFIRELSPTDLSEPAAAPGVLSIIVEPTPAWHALADQDRLAWLNDRRAYINELMMGSNRLFASSRLTAPDQILLFWNVTDNTSADAIVELLRSEDVLQHFVVKWVAGAPFARTQNDVWEPFLSASFPSANPTPAEPM